MNKGPFIALGFLVVLALLGPHVSPYSASQFDMSHMLAGPDARHWLGYDESGRDILSRLLWGAYYSLIISLAVTSLSTFIGLVVGFVAGYFRGSSDKVFIFVADIFQSFPGILLAIAVAAFVSPGVGNLIWLLTFVGWVGYARVTRAQVLTLRNREFIEALRANGIPLWRLFLFHMLPNMAGPLLIQATFGMAGVILIESTLSFLGLGLPVTIPSWGKMIDGGSSYLLVAPHISLFPGLAILFTVLTFNLLGDSLRDKLAKDH